MKQLEIVIQNPTGLHARPAKVLVKLAKQFQSDIKIKHGEKTANAKSMVSVLTGSILSEHLARRLYAALNFDDPTGHGQRNCPESSGGSVES